MKLTSPSFGNGQSIPSRCTCEGENVHPELCVENAPVGVISFALLMDDPDIPAAVKISRGIEVFDHWVLYNIPREVFEIEEGKSVGSEGLNGRGSTGYTGPCPPDREHRYFFKLYALDVSTLSFVKSPTKTELEKAIAPHTIEKAVYIGRYDRAR